MGYAIQIGALATVAVLAGCGGGGGGSGATLTSDPARMSFDAMRNGLMAIDREMGQGQVNAVMAPTQGRATYNGYMTGGVSLEEALNDPEFASRVQLNANFDRQTMDGRFYQFADSDNNPVQGELTLSNGQIDGSRFEADVAGRLTDSDGTRIRVSGETSGGFYGAGALGIAGGVVVRDDVYPDSGLVGVYVAKK
ncbi:MAG: transferrin-binding protein-like solute binding protein [Paracoccus sp. (in: a-proteobacteria)]|uniref:transferrin-binding protein-like solute binding protein n=1 Tax=Paracoccus sp. TaxID=267 RepID=UPI0026DF434B|nr:transferrin-binding protein-like solute binding protein [Paracoccus sp. (in: a-proteobacteria)]MDO5630633.1 transferrin-binding protein-like solute binding protein [Paracoccus sp. (in: a-proteobacteria)]